MKGICDFCDYEGDLIKTEFPNPYYTKEQIETTGKKHIAIYYLCALCKNGKENK